MKKKFEEMSFDELKLYRREGLWRSLGILLVVIAVIVGMIIMITNHSSQSSIYRFRTLGLIVIIGLLGYLRTIANANRVMREHPDWIRNSGFSAKIPLPREWHVKRSIVIGGALLSVIIGFITLYQPTVVRERNVPDTPTSTSIVNQNNSTYDSGMQSISDSATEVEVDSSSVTERGQE